MIDLSGQQPFASGGNRLCFRHPQAKHLCVKVMRPGRLAELRGRAPWYKKLLNDRQFDDNEREADGYAQRAVVGAAEDSPVWRHLARWHGIHETSEGAGAVSELILDEAGEPAPTLETYLVDNGLDDTIRGAIERFASWLLETRVLTKNILPHNLVVQWREGQPELVLIDGLGSASFLPLAEMSDTAATNYIHRRISRMWRRVHWEVSDRSIPWKEAERQSRGA